MTTIKGMLDKVKSLDLRSEVPVILQRTSYEIESLNKEQLYNYGVDSTGTKLKEYSSEYYAREKNYDNPRPGKGIPDLFVTGAFYKGFGVVVSSKKFIIDSTDSKSASLEARYGSKIFGLTADNKKVYALGVFYAELKKYVSLKLSAS